MEDNPFAKYLQVDNTPSIENAEEQNPFAKYTSSKEPEVDTVDMPDVDGIVDSFVLNTKAAQWGFQEGAKNLYLFMANIPGGVERLSNWLSEKTGYIPEDIREGESIQDAIKRESRSIGLGPLADWMRARAEIVMPSEWEKENAPQGLGPKIIAGLASAPAEIVKYIPAVKGLGAIGGFAAVDMIAVADQPTEVILEHGIKGALTGKMFKALEPLTGVSRIGAAAALGGGLTAAEGGSTEDIVASAATLGTLMVPGAWKAPAHYQPKEKFAEISPMKEPAESYTPVSDAVGKELFLKLTTLNSNLSEIKTKLRSEKSPEIRDTLKVMRSDVRQRLNDTVNQYREFKATKAMESQIQATLTHAQRIADTNGTDPRYELYKIFPKLAPEYKLPNQIEIAANMRRDSKNPSAIIMDHQSLKDRIIKKIQTGVDDTGEPIFKELRTEKDISGFTEMVVGSVKPGKFMMDNTLIRWGVDTLYQHRTRIENMVQEFLFAPRMTSTVGVTTMRGAKMVPTEVGGLTTWNGLFRKSQRKVLDALIKDEVAGKRGVVTADAELARRHKLSAEEIKAYRSIRTMNDRILDLVNETIAAVRPDLKPVNKLPNWLPHQFLGDFRVYVKDSDGKLVMAVPADTKIGAKLIANKIKKQHPNLEVQEPRDVGFYDKSDPSVTLFAEAMLYLGNKHPLAEAVANTYKAVLAEKGFMKHGTERQWVEGWTGSEAGITGVKNFEKSIELFVKGGVNWVMRQQTDAVMNPVFADGTIAGRYPNTMKYLQRYKNNAFGQNSAVTNAISKGFKEYVGAHGVSRAFGMINHATLVWKLFRFTFFMSQAWQPIVSVPPKLMALSHEGYKGSVTKAMGRAFLDFFIPRKESMDATRYAVRSGTIAPKYVAEGLEGDVLRGATKTRITGREAGELTKEWLTLEKPAALFEEGSRHFANLTFYNYLRSAGASHAESVKTAAYLTDRTMVEYNNQERPMIFTEGGLGVLGKPYGLFQTFKFNALAQYIEYAKLAKGTGDFKPLTTLIFGTLMTAGLTGVIGAGEYNALVSAANSNLGTNWPTLEELAITTGMPDIIHFGAPSVGINVDMSSTMNAPGIVSEPFFRAPGLEFAYDIGSSAIKLLVREANGTATPSDHQEFWINASPSSLKGAVEAYYTNKKFGKIIDVPVPDPTHRDRGTVTRSLHDWYARLLGGRSLEESRQLRAFYEITRIQREAAATDETLINLIAYSVTNDLPTPEFAWNILAEHGMHPSTIQNRVKSQIMLWNTTLLDRTMMKRNMSQQILQQPIIQALDEQE
jgi:hypothetical protein